MLLLVAPPKASHEPTGASPEQFCYRRPGGGGVNFGFAHTNNLFLVFGKSSPTINVYSPNNRTICWQMVHTLSLVYFHGDTDILVSRIRAAKFRLRHGTCSTSVGRKGEGTTGGDQLALAQCPQQNHKHAGKKWQCCLNISLEYASGINADHVALLLCQQDVVVVCH